MRIVALSDLHLGRRSSRLQDVESLRFLFQGTDVAIINGDGVDFGWASRDRAFRLRDDLVRYLRRIVGEVIWIRGNHDLHVDGPIFTRVDDIVFTHGHALFDVPRAARTFQEAFEASYPHHVRRHSTHRHGGPLANMAERIVQETVPLALASRLLVGSPSEVDLSLLMEAAGEGVREVCIGHLHVSHLLPREDVKLFVTGAWTGKAPSTVFVHEDGRSSLRQVVASGDGLHLGPVVP
jgi:predicted phosphodiesterase